MSEVPGNSAPPWAAALFDALNRCTPKQAYERRAALPYCVQTMADLPERALVLNRRYKPLGVAGRDWVLYEDHPEAHIHIEVFKLLKPTLGGGEYFFNDGNSPWHSTQHMRVYREKMKDLVSPWIEPSEWES